MIGSLFEGKGAMKPWCYITHYPIYYTGITCYIYSKEIISQYGWSKDVLSMLLEAEQAALAQREAQSFPEREAEEGAEQVEEPVSLCGERKKVPFGAEHGFNRLVFAWVKLC